MSQFAREWLHEVAMLAEALDPQQIERVAEELLQLRLRHGRLFILGNGGSAANASHAANDFRRIASIEAYAPTDNVAELTALTNDLGWKSTFAEWLKESQLDQDDGLLVFSVGGGSSETSTNLVAAIDLASQRNATILAIVGRSSGYAAQQADAWVRLPTVNPERVTPHSESFQAVLWHLLCWQLRSQ